MKDIFSPAMKPQYNTLSTFVAYRYWRNYVWSDLLYVSTVSKVIDIIHDVITLKSKRKFRQYRVSQKKSLHFHNGSSFSHGSKYTDLNDKHW